MNAKECASGIYNTAVHNFRQAAERLRLDGAIAEKIICPNEKIELRLTPSLSNGKLVTINCFVVHHSMVLGPSKGGIRMTPTVSLDDVVGLSMEMTWKTSLIGVPFGGGKSGIQCDASKLSAVDKEIIIRSFTRSARRHLGPEIYIAAPDMGTNENDMGHISDCLSYSSGTAITSGCYVTGKPVLLGGILGRREATGKGVIYTSIAACKELGISFAGAKIAVQGFGNVGSVAAIEAAKLGAKIVAAADLTGGVRDDAGIDAAALAEHVKKTGGIKGYKQGQAIDAAAVLETPCDILIPAAAGSQITAGNAERVKARIIAEGANAPTTPEGDEILNKNKVFVIPDILCNAGGVFVSYLEYTQETQREQMTLAAVETRLEERMKQKFNEVYQYANSHKIPMRSAAMDLAVGKVVEGVYARGLLP